MTTHPRNPEDLAGALAGAGRARGRQRDCGHFDIRIDLDGTWYYHGSPITRKPLVKLFSTVLIRDEAGRYWLETPVEKGRIDVDDAPFTAVAVTVAGAGRDQTLTFRTNVDDMVTADAAHPIRVAAGAVPGGPRPYLHVRDGLEALITRSVYYELAELVTPGDGTSRGAWGVWSCGTFFRLAADAA